MYTPCTNAVKDPTKPLISPSAYQHFSFFKIPNQIRESTLSLYKYQAGYSANLSTEKLKSRTRFIINAFIKVLNGNCPITSFTPDSLPKFISPTS